LDFGALDYSTMIHSESFFLPILLYLIFLEIADFALTLSLLNNLALPKCNIGNCVFTASGSTDCRCPF